MEQAVAMPKGGTLAGTRLVSLASHYLRCAPSALSLARDLSSMHTLPASAHVSCPFPQSRLGDARRRHVCALLGTPCCSKREI